MCINFSIKIEGIIIGKVEGIELEFIEVDWKAEGVE